MKALIRPQPASPSIVNEMARQYMAALLNQRNYRIDIKMRGNRAKSKKPRKMRRK